MHIKIFIREDLVPLAPNAFADSTCCVDSGVVAPSDGPTRPKNTTAPEGEPWGQ